MMSGVSSKKISDKIVKYYRRIVERRFFIIWRKRKYELERSIILENWQICNSFRKFS
jgi:hypothetical protein